LEYPGFAMLNPQRWEMYPPIHVEKQARVPQLALHQRLSIFTPLNVPLGFDGESFTVLKRSVYCGGYVVYLCRATLGVMHELKLKGWQAQLKGWS
jgi:hypothetical protein